MNSNNCNLEGKNLVITPVEKAHRYFCFIYHDEDRVSQPFEITPVIPGARTEIKNILKYIILDEGHPMEDVQYYLRVFVVETDSEKPQQVMSEKVIYKKPKVKIKKEEKKVKKEISRAENSHMKSWLQNLDYALGKSDVTDVDMALINIDKKIEEWRNQGYQDASLDGFQQESSRLKSEFEKVSREKAKAKTQKKTPPPTPPTPPTPSVPPAPTPTQIVPPPQPQPSAEVIELLKQITSLRKEIASRDEQSVPPAPTPTLTPPPKEEEVKTSVPWWVGGLIAIFALLAILTFVKCTPHKDYPVGGRLPSTPVVSDAGLIPGGDTTNSSHSVATTIPKVGGTNSLGHGDMISLESVRTSVSGGTNNSAITAGKIDKLYINGQDLSQVMLEMQKKSVWPDNSEPNIIFDPKPDEQSGFSEIIETIPPGMDARVNIPLGWNVEVFTKMPSNKYKKEIVGEIANHYRYKNESTEPMVIGLRCRKVSTFRPIPGL